MQNLLFPRNITFVGQVRCLFFPNFSRSCSGGPKHHCVHFCTLELSGSANGKAVLGWLLTDLADVWEEHGVGLLQRLAVTDPGKLA
jgi:hypothetical protein